METLAVLILGASGLWFACAFTLAGLILVRAVRGLHTPRPVRPSHRIVVIVWAPGSNASATGAHRCFVRRLPGHREEVRHGRLPGAVP